MKRFLLGFLLAVLLLLGYWVWPFLGLHALADDLAARNSAALNQDVDFMRLRGSVTAQLIPAYLRVTGRAAKLGVFGTAVASAIGASIADPLVAQIINAENLIKLLNGGTVPTEFGNVAINPGKLPTSSLGAAWQAWLGTTYWMDQFSIGIPADAPPSEQYRLRLQLLQWHWKLTGLDLPASVRDQLAQDLAKKFP
jgi:hypothetical protein